MDIHGSVHIRLHNNMLLVQWWETERRILVWLGPAKHKNAENRILSTFYSVSMPKKLKHTSTDFFKTSQT